MKGLSRGFAIVSCFYDPYQAERVKGTGFTYTAKIYVEDVKVKTGDGENDPKVKKEGKTYTLNLDKGSTGILQTEGNYQPILFQSSRSSIVFVDEAGILSARAVGKANLVARVNGKKITVAVTVR